MTSSSRGIKGKNVQKSRSHDIIKRENPAVPHNKFDDNGDLEWNKH